MPLPVQLVLPNASTKLILAIPLHVSLAVAMPVLLVVGGAVHSRVMLVGQVMLGRVVSLKLIVCVQLALLPQPSVAVQVRRIMPLPVQLVLPKASTKLMSAIPLQLSVAVATPVLSVVGNVVHSSVMSVGQVMIGRVVSLKLMVCVQLALFPQRSVAVQVRRMVPRPVQLVVSKASRKLTLETPLHVSVAVALPALFVVGDTVHSRVMSLGQVMTGGVVSWKLIVCTQLVRLPQPSIAVQVRRMAPLPVQLVLLNAS